MNDLRALDKYRETEAERQVYGVCGDHGNGCFKVFTGGQAVTLEKLEQYDAKRREARLWSKELDKLKSRMQIVKDTVSGSSSDFPYTAHPVTITGKEHPSSRIQRREQRLNARIAQLQQDVDEIDAFIDSLEDSQLRQIIHCHYILGYSWVKTAGMTHITEGAAKMMVRRYFKRA